METTTSFVAYLEYLKNYKSGIYQSVATWGLRFDNPEEELESLLHGGCSINDIISSGPYSSLQEFYTAHEDEIFSLYSDSDLDLDESDPIRCLSCFAFEDTAWQIHYYFHHVL